MLDEEHNLVPCEDLLTWARWFDTADRVVAQTELPNGYFVSTVFLGLDHNFLRGPPLVFETMVFPDGEQRRYGTWAEAEAGHAIVVALTEDRPPQATVH